MKTFSKFMVAATTLALLSGCSFSKKSEEPITTPLDQEVQQIMDAEHEIDEQITELENSGVEEELNQLDSETKSIMDTEVEIDQEIDEMEAEAL